MRGAVGVLVSTVAVTVTVTVLLTGASHASIIRRGRDPKASLQVDLDARMTTPCARVSRFPRGWHLQH